METDTNGSGSKTIRSARTMMAAMVIGTALGALGSDARAATADPQAITDIGKYCTVCWRNARLPEDRWSDCTQEVMVRLLERVERDRWGNIFAEETNERREFLRAIDAVKKRTQRARKYSSLADDHADPRNELAGDLRHERETLNRAAGAVLNDRQRAIVELTTGGYGVPEIAAQLGTTVERVSDEKYKAIRKLRSHFGVA
ncbi:MAG: sigma-70 family RNA polymerase sigma factor [Gemmataceae bacterium]|nr:sigma-70 family RNA polymerase sigma factor [Gemmataceae bacterium]